MVGIGRVGLLGDLAQAHGAQLLVAQLARQLIGERGREAGVAQDHRVEHGGQTGLLARDLLGLGAQGRPDPLRKITFYDFQLLSHVPLALHPSPVSSGDPFRAYG